MQQLTDSFLLYHGSYMTVSSIDLSKCRNGLDFGHGFYVTSSYQQAHSYVPSAVRKAIATKKIPSNFDIADGRINVHRFRTDPNLLIHYFEEAGLDWLHFVAANRDNSLFPKLIEKFKSTDIIGGKVADDNTARTLTFYTQGDWGVPGTPDAIASFEFVRSERYGDIK